VCPACWAAIRPLLPPLCVTCGDPLPSWRVISLAMSLCARCRRRSFRLKPEPTGVDRSRCGGAYEGALRDIIHAFKYDGRRSLAVPLAGIMRSAGAELLQDADVIVPVPLHAVRRLRRGFNQASDLARRLDHPVVNALWRTRATSPQTGLTAAARRRNVRRAFRLSPVMPRQNRLLINERIVVLIDDVSTTGATLDACARVLKEAGAREVRALTAARALRQTSVPTQL
jgi:ComF family protein